MNLSHRIVSLSADNYEIIKNMVKDNQDLFHKLDLQGTTTNTGCFPTFIVESKKEFLVSRYEHLMESHNNDRHLLWKVWEGKHVRIFTHKYYGTIHG